MYGRVIIAERNLAAADKTIAPTNIGGLAGGDKFVVHDIVFKFPTTVAPGTTSSAMYVQQHQVCAVGHSLHALAAAAMVPTTLRPSLRNMTSSRLLLLMRPAFPAW